MTNQEYFYIRDTRSLGTDPECPVCGDRLSLTNIAVFDGNNEPLCDVCAWDKAPEFASLVNLNAAAHYHSVGGMPDDVFHGGLRADIERRVASHLARNVKAYEPRLKDVRVRAGQAAADEYGAWTFELVGRLVTAPNRPRVHFTVTRDALRYRVVF